MHIQKFEQPIKMLPEIRRTSLGAQMDALSALRLPAFRPMGSLSLDSLQELESGTALSHKKQSQTQPSRLMKKYVLFLNSGTFANLPNVLVIDLTMVNLYFQPDAQLTAQDRLVLDVLQKDSAHYWHGKLQEVSSAVGVSRVKQPRFDSISPEGAFRIPPPYNWKHYCL
jgi:hypothetical protein